MSSILGENVIPALGDPYRFPALRNHLHAWEYAPLRFPDDDGSGGNADKGPKDKGGKPTDQGANDADEGDDDDVVTDDSADTGDDNVDDDSPSVPKSVYDARVKEATKSRKKAAELRKELDKIKANLPTEEELAEFREHRVQQARAEEDRMKQQGKFEELTQKRQQEFDTKLAEKDAAIAALQKDLANANIDFALSSVIPKYTKVPVNAVARLIRGDLSYENGKVVVLDSEGDHRIGSNGKDMTIDEFVQLYVEENDWLAPADKPSGTGGRERQGGAGGKAGKFTAEDIENMTQAEYEANEAEIMAQLGTKG